MYRVRVVTSAAAAVLLMAFAGPAPALAETIEAALVRAYQNNPQLNAQRALVRSTDENVPQALSGYRPKVALTASAGYQYTDANATNAAGMLTPVTSMLSYFPASSVTAIATLNPTLAGGGDYSSVLVGNSASGLLLFQDNNLAPSTGDAKIRFVNVSPDAGPINVQLAFASVVQGLGINTASNYFDFPQNALPGYTVTAQLVSSSTNALTVSGVELTAGGTYTMYIMGPAASLQGILSRDN